MTLRARLVVAALVVGLASGVAACGHRGPDAGAVDDGPQVRLDNLNRQDVRVADVAWRLALANAELCPVNRLRAGWTLQSASQYGSELRPLAESRYGLDGDLPGILAVPRGAPAAVAGLQPGDLILSVNGQLLQRGTGAAESYDGLQANIDVLDQALARGRVELQVRRDGSERSVALRPVQACAYSTQVLVADTLSGSADGRHIFIPAGMANLAASEDQLAFVLAHELAHAVLEHRTQREVTGVRGASNWAISMRRGLSLSAEADADRMGVFLAARAGFDPYAALEFLTLLEQADPGVRFIQVNFGGIYEPAPVRRRTLASVLADITERRETGRALIP